MRNTTGSSGIAAPLSAAWSSVVEPDPDHLAGTGQWRADADGRRVHRQRPVAYRISHGGQQDRIPEQLPVDVSGERGEVTQLSTVVERGRPFMADRADAQKLHASPPAETPVGKYVASSSR
ncbi:hypothetical protein [Nocardioides sp. B-3]|uniref:hypothetical protein n=1 Tax=Nocardioides sp. B-3 TaxID=2895565 RepID=UPI0021528F7E|nr:hypothetical protein [Nocardioides sp. B-3]UUZ59836.1 hypothetical protein LP418_01805 [Nocardioides sp. B-3]